MLSLTLMLDADASEAPTDGVAGSLPNTEVPPVASLVFLRPDSSAGVMRHPFRKLRERAN